MLPKKKSLPASQKKQAEQTKLQISAEFRFRSDTITYDLVSGFKFNPTLTPELVSGFKLYPTLTYDLVSDFIL